MPRNMKRKKQAVLEPEQAAGQELGNGILGPDTEAEEAEEKIRRIRGKEKEEGRSSSRPGLQPSC